MLHTFGCADVAASTPAGTSHQGKCYSNIIYGQGEWRPARRANEPLWAGFAISPRTCKHPGPHPRSRKHEVLSPKYLVFCLPSYLFLLPFSMLKGYS